MHDGNPVGGVRHHFQKCVGRGVTRDETEIPGLALGPDQHRLEAAAPDDTAAKPGEDRGGIAPVVGVGVRPGEASAMQLMALRVNRHLA